MSDMESELESLRRCNEGAEEFRKKAAAWNALQEIEIRNLRSIVEGQDEDIENLKAAMIKQCNQLKSKYDELEALCNDDEARSRGSFWVPYYRNFQKFISELLPSAV